MKTSEIIKAARKAKRLTQAQLAEQVSVSTQAVSQWEKGVTRPTLFSALRLARALDLERDWLLEDTSIENEQGRPPKSRFAQQYRGLIPLINIDEVAYFRRNINFAKTTLPTAQALLTPTFPIEGYGFALEIDDDQLRPWFSKSDILIFECDLWPSDGDIVTSQITDMPSNQSVIGRFFFNGDNPFAFIERPQFDKSLHSAGVGGTLVEHRRLRPPPENETVSWSRFPRKRVA